MDGKMPQNPETVAARIAELGGSDLAFVGKEVKALPDILEEGESLLAIASGRIDLHTRLLVLTDSRLIVLLRLTLHQKTFEIPVAEVRSIDVKSGRLLSELEIDAGGQIKKLISVDKQLAQNVAQAFSRLQSNAPYLTSSEHPAAIYPLPPPQTTPPPRSTPKRLWLQAGLLVLVIAAAFWVLFFYQ